MFDALILHSYYGPPMWIHYFARSYAAHCIWVTSEHILLPPLSWLQGVLGFKLNSNLICPIELDPSNVGNNDGTDPIR
ncbi:hypothetical protein AAC387_Pa11g1564 [Persea americana]